MAPLYVRSTRRTTPVRVVPQVPARSAAPVPYGLPIPAPDAPQRPAGISLCMIVKDEERFLDACLRSVHGVVDEICIVDTGSSDRTVEIAHSHGARVEHRPWRNDFAWARNEALGLAGRRWILVLDADEELDPASADLLRRLRDVPAALTGLWVRCNNLSDDYKGTGISSHALVRFFPNSERIRYLSPVHEFITLDGQPTGIEARPAPLSITHHGYLSEIVKSRKKSERNLALVKAATEANPDEPFNWYNLGTTSLLCGDPDGALVALEKMRAMVGSAQRGFIPNALAQLADLYTDRGECERAVTIANESLAKAPNFANAHFALGRALAKAKRYPEARAAFEAAIADSAHAARQFIVDDEVSIWKAHSEIGSSYGNENNDAMALAWFDRALVNRPNVIPVRINRAKALERLGRFDEARAAFAQLAADEPGDVHSIDYINYLLRREMYVDAAAAIEHELPAVTPRTRASLLVTAAQLVARTGSGDVGELLERAVAAHAGAADALEALEAYYRARDDRAGLERLAAAEATATPVTALDYRRRAQADLTAHRFADAEAAARAGLALDAADAMLRYTLGAALVQSGRKSEAVEELARLGADAGDPGLRAAFLRSIVLGDLGRHAEALAAIDGVIACAPHEVDARIHRFRLALALGRDADAEATLRAALGLDNRVAAELATWLMSKGRYEDARRVADCALAAS